MDVVIDRLCAFAAKYFSINENDIYSRGRSMQCILARHIIWYILHYKHKIPSSVIADKFFRTKRMIFWAVSKIKYGVETQRYYKEVFDSFYKEYKSICPDTIGNI